MTKDELQTLPKYQLVRGLLDGIIPFDEIMRAFDIFTSQADLPGEICAMVYYCRRSHYHIIFNDSLAPEAREKVLFHEVHHIIETMPKGMYIVGLDCQHLEFEQDADLFVREVATVFEVRR